MRSIEWWVAQNSYVIGMTLSVLEGRFPIAVASLRTVSAAFCCSAEVSTH